jgi:hypothetical protein
MAARRNVIGVICNELYTSAATLRQGDDATVALGDLLVPHSVVVVTLGTHV